LEYLGVSGGDNIKMHLEKIECKAMARLNLAQVRNQWWPLVNTVMKLWVP